MKIKSNGKEEQIEEEQREGEEERESKKKKIGAEYGFGDEIELKKPRMDQPPQNWKGNLLFSKRNCLFYLGWWCGREGENNKIEK